MAVTLFSTPTLIIFIVARDIAHTIRQIWAAFLNDVANVLKQFNTLYLRLNEVNGAKKLDGY